MSCNTINNSWSLPPFCPILFEELTFPATSPPVTTCCSSGSSPSISPIKHVLPQFPMDLDPLNTIPLPDVDSSLEVSDLDIDSVLDSPQKNLSRQSLAEVLKLPETPLNAALLDHIDGIYQPSRMDTAFLDDTLSHSLVDCLSDLAISEPSSPKPAPLPQATSTGSSRFRPARSRATRTMSAEQRVQLGSLLGNRRVRFASGSNRNALARELGVPATEIFKFVEGSKRRDDRRVHFSL